MLDENTLMDRSANWEGGAKQSFDQGLYKADAKLFVKCRELGGRPKVSSPMIVDGKSILWATWMKKRACTALSL